MELSTTINGLSDIYKVFNNLPRSTQRRAGNQALRAGAAPVREAVVSNLNRFSDVFTGLSKTRGNIRIYTLRKYRGQQRVAVQVKRGLVNPAKRDGNGQPVRVGMYVAVLEYGKENQRPRPSFRAAIRDKKNQAIDALTKEFNKRMVDVIRDAKGKR